MNKYYSVVVSLSKRLNWKILIFIRAYGPDRGLTDLLHKAIFCFMLGGCHLSTTQTKWISLFVEMYKTQVIIQAGGLASEANKWPGEAPPAHVCQCSVWAEGPGGGLDVSAAYLRQASKLLGAKPPPFLSVNAPSCERSEQMAWAKPLRTRMSKLRQGRRPWRRFRLYS